MNTEEKNIFNLGKIKKYKVTRETKLGYMLSDGENEYFLHRNESNYQILQPDDIVEAFIYTDKKGRLAATLYLPTMTTEQIGFGTVVGVNFEYGLFINIGVSKDVLLSIDDLPVDKNKWPRVDDRIVCKLKVHGGKLIAKPATKTDFKAAEKSELKIGEVYQAYVYRHSSSGINLVTENFNVIFVFQADVRKEYRLGEKVEVRITRKNEDDYSGVILFEKAQQIVSDREKILAYLRKNYGAMAITEKSDALVIKKVFDMSKRAFKTALANLYKEGLIEIQEDKIVLLS